MTLEEQLAALDAIGIKLNEGATVEDLLYSYDRAEYEKQPFDALLFMLGSEIEREPWGRYFSSVAWNFDAECIVENGDYVRIVNRLAELAGVSNYMSGVRTVSTWMLALQRWNIHWTDKLDHLHRS